MMLFLSTMRLLPSGRSGGVGCFPIFGKLLARMTDVVVIRAIALSPHPNESFIGLGCLRVGKGIPRVKAAREQQPVSSRQRAAGREQQAESKTQ
jgi:hypothetical protein